MKMFFCTVSFSFIDFRTKNMQYVDYYPGLFEFLMQLIVSNKSDIPLNLQTLSAVTLGALLSVPDIRSDICSKTTFFLTFLPSILRLICNRITQIPNRPVSAKDIKTVLIQNIAAMLSILKKTAKYKAYNSYILVELLFLNHQVLLKLY